MMPISAEDITTAWPAGPMARRLTTNQEIAGSIPASVNIFAFLAFYNPVIDIRHKWICIPSNFCVSAVSSEYFPVYITGCLEKFVFFICLRYYYVTPLV